MQDPTEQNPKSFSLNQNLKKRADPMQIEQYEVKLLTTKDTVYVSTKNEDIK